MSALGLDSVFDKLRSLRMTGSLPQFHAEADGMSLSLLTCLLFLPFSNLECFSMISSIFMTSRRIISWRPIEGFSETLRRPWRERLGDKGLERW